MKQGSSKSSLFLMEMIFVVLFFALIAAVYAQVFARAHKTGEESRNLTEAVMVSRNLAEAFYADGADEAALQDLFPGAKITTDPPSSNSSDTTLILLYDGNWQEMAPEVTNETRFSANLLVSREAPFDLAQITVTDEKDVSGLPLVLYSLSLKRYAPDETEGN